VIQLTHDCFRYLSSLITSTPSASSFSSQAKINGQDLERLNAIEKEVHSINLDPRSIREAAYREAQSTAGAKRTQRPFQRLVAAQHEKYKRDKYLRDRLLKEKKIEQHRTHKREDQISRAMQPRRNMSDAQKQHRNKKSVSSAFNFLQFMRPISSAFLLDSVSATGPKRSAEELDFAPSHKPSLVLTVADAKVTKFINNERSFTFQLDTDDGGHYLLQAVSRREMNKWIANIGRMSTIAAKRRLTWLGDSPRPQLADHLSNIVVPPPQDPKAGEYNISCATTFFHSFRSLRDRPHRPPST
jgi:GTPase-activating protein BEM2